MKKPLSLTQKTLNVWAIILIVWSIYRANFRLAEWIDELIIKPLIFVLPVVYYVIKIEKIAFFEAVDLKKRLKKVDWLISITIGLLFVFTIALANYLKNKHLQFNTTQPILMIVVLAFATGITEEILSRGFVLKRLYADSKNLLSATFLSSILFFFLHVPMLFANLKITGNILLLFMVTDMLLSLVISFVYLERKNLWVAILIHAFYNFSLALLV